MSQTGMSIVRKADLNWIDRVNIDGWPSRIAHYYENPEHRVRFRLVDFPERAIEPRHVHAGRHGTTILNGQVLVDGLTLGPLDVILGPRARTTTARSRTCRPRRTIASSSTPGSRGGRCLPETARSRP